MNIQRDVMTYDLLIVGAGPAGLSAAIRAKQLASAAGKELSVCVLEKAAQVGAHILSGAVIDPSSLDELLPFWKDSSPLKTPVVNESFYWLTSKQSYSIPMQVIPPVMHNDESPRVWWRLQHLREWSHEEETESIYTGRS